MHDPLTLGQLAAFEHAEVRGDGSVLIHDVTHDSREVGAGGLFVAVRGFTVDGHRFVAEVADRASAAVVEEWVDADLPQMRVADARVALGRLADRVHGHPSGSMAVIGVTGTNGKTTVTYLVESIVNASGRTAGRIGTTGASVAGEAVPVPRTSPEASDLHRLLGRMASAGVEIAAIEVSSHALALQRVNGVEFDVVAFTNLSQDHLDFHADMGDYFETKAGLFDGRARREVIWVDDPYGARLFDRRPTAVSVGFDDARVRATHVRAGLERSTFTLETPAGHTEVTLPLGGDFNVANAAIAAACALETDTSLDSIAEGLSLFGGVPGRMESVERGQPFSVVVDYAHSPVGIEIVVDSARRASTGRVIVVVGAGGDRDREKRPRMGSAAAGADVLYITSDNPRSEDPLAIIRDVEIGARSGDARVVTEVDRKAAIQQAIAEADDGDVVLILGKGHETGQDIGGVVHPFDDRAVVHAALTSAGYGS